MSQPYLTFLSELTAPDGTMLIALTGWMDGGRVSTGTLKGIAQGRTVEDYARLDTDPFYVLNLPGSMEVAAMLRPEVKYDEGLVDEYELPPDTFYIDPSSKLVLFSGREPNLRWRAFADVILAIARRAQVKRIIFMGSFGGTVPHTRQPRMFASVSHAHLKPMLQEHGIRFTNYHGPSSFATNLLWHCAKQDVEMINIVCEIPNYLQGINPPSIEAVTRRLAKLLNLPADLDSLRRASDDWEVQITQLVEKDEELAENVRKLEKEYDDELIGEAES